MSIDYPVSENAAVLENKNRIRSRARAYSRRGILSQDDLEQEGMIGVILAYRRFDKTAGFSFRTYSYQAICRSMRRAMRDNARLELHHTDSMETPIGDGVCIADTLISPDPSPEELVAKKQLLNKIGPADLALLELRSSGKTVREIAGLLDVSKSLAALRVSDTVSRAQLLMETA